MLKTHVSGNINGLLLSLKALIINFLKLLNSFRLKHGVLMAKYVFVKIGGSFITYKNKPVSINYTALTSLKEIFSRVLGRDNLRIIVGNGGGSFAHYVVAKYSSCSEVNLVIKCHEATKALNKIIVDYLVENGIPATSVQTSAIIYYNEESGEFEVFYKPVKKLANMGIIPIVYGECIPVAGKPLILSTESVFSLIARHIKPSRIVLLTDVSGIYTCDPKKCKKATLIRKITPSSVSEVLKILQEQYEHLDATGGILGKVSSMAKLATELGVEVLIVSGFDADSATTAILGGYPQDSTLISPTD